MQLMGLMGCRTWDKAAPKEQAVEICLVAPATRAKYSKLVMDSCKVIQGGIEATKRALDITAETPDPEDMRQVSNEKTTILRFRLLKMFEEQAPADILDELVAPSLKRAASDLYAASAREEKNEADGNIISSAAPKAPGNNDTDGQAQLEGGSSASPGKVLPSPGKSAKSSCGSSVAGDLHLRGKTPAERVSGFMQKVHSDAGNRAPAVENPRALLCQAHMECSLERIMDSHSVPEMDEYVGLLDKAFIAARQLRDGAVKAATVLKQHVNTKQRGEARKRALEAKSRERGAPEAEEASEGAFGASPVGRI